MPHSPFRAGSFTSRANAPPRHKEDMLQGRPFSASWIIDSHWPIRRAAEKFRFHRPRPRNGWADTSPTRPSTAALRAPVQSGTATPRLRTPHHFLAMQPPMGTGTEPATAMAFPAAPSIASRTATGCRSWPIWTGPAGCRCARRSMCTTRGRDLARWFLWTSRRAEGIASTDEKLVQDRPASNGPNRVAGLGASNSRGDLFPHHAVDVYSRLDYCEIPITRRRKPGHALGNEPEVSMRQRGSLGRSLQRLASPLSSPSTPHRDRWPCPVRSCSQPRKEHS